MVIGPVKATGPVLSQHATMCKMVQQPLPLPCEVAPSVISMTGSIVKGSIRPFQNRTKLCGTWLKPGLFRESAGIPAGFHDPYFTFILHANVGTRGALSRNDTG